MSTHLMRWNEETALEIFPTEKINISDEVQLEFTEKKRLVVIENQSKNSFEIGDLFKIQGNIFLLVDSSLPMCILKCTRDISPGEAFILLNFNFLKFLHSLMQWGMKNRIFLNKQKILNFLSSAIRMVFGLGCLYISVFGNSPGIADAPVLDRESSQQSKKTSIYQTLNNLKSEILEKTVTVISEKPIKINNINTRKKIEYRKNCKQFQKSHFDPDVLKFLSIQEINKLKNEEIKNNQRCKI